MYSSVLLLACTATYDSRPQTAGPTSPRGSIETPRKTTPDITFPPNTFNIGAQQVRMLATLAAFVSAYNDGRVSDAMALVSERIVFSDCDYRELAATIGEGRDLFQKWLAARAVDHDQLQITRVFNDNPTGSSVVGVEFRRNSDALRALGFREGVTSPGAKVAFTSDGRLIIAFISANSNDPACQLGQLR